jgi:protein-tyrosine-phosphatase
MTIHFICTGNIYRSRLAEAYCASKGVPGLRVSSSGIGTSLHRGIPIAPYAARVLSQHGLERFAAPSWQQTTAGLVRASDILVFMEREHYRFCKDWIDPIRQRVEIWNIPDVGPVDAARIITKVEQTFEMIGQRTDALLTALRLS